MQEPRAAVSSFQISGRYGVYGQGSASPVLRGWSQERKGQVSVWLQTVPTLSRPLSLSLPASPFNSPFNSSLVFFSYSFSLSLSLWLCVIFLGVCTSIIPSSSFSRLFLVSYGCRASASRFRRGVNGEQYLDLDLREISRNSLEIGVPRRRNLFGVQWSSFNWPKLNRIQTG